MSATNLLDIKQRRRQAKQELQNLEQQELSERIARALKQNAEHRTICKALKKLNAQLHRKRVEVTRKTFAIEVRHRRLKNIPLEITQIQKEQIRLEGLVAELVQQKTTLEEQDKRIVRNLTEAIKSTHNEAIPA